MADGTKIIEINPPAPAASIRRRHHCFQKMIDKTLQEYDSRIDEAKTVLSLLQQHIVSPPFGQVDEDIVSNAVDTAIRLLAPVKNISDRIELERVGKAMEHAHV